MATALVGHETREAALGLRVVGAGLGRTGTHSLKVALETLLGGPCYHMIEVFPRPEHIPLWHQAILGDEPDWDRMLEGFVAAVDWPAAAVWSQLAQAYPDSLVLLSTRSTSQAWWDSFAETILRVMQRGALPGMEAWHDMSEDMLGKLSPSYADRDACIAAYEAHNEGVRRDVPGHRLIDWTPADGWGPICAGLRIPEPELPFPHVNTTDEFRAMAGLD